MIRSATTQGVTADALRVEVYLTAYEAMRPAAIDGETATEQAHAAVLGGAPDVDQKTAGMGLQIQLPVAEEWLAGRRRCAQRGRKAVM
ncbi:MAG: hypothetical protein ACE5I7_19780 [Candidatus Binatia bacterium]